MRERDDRLDGSYWIGTLPSAGYTVSITPPTSAYVAGYYAAGWSGNFSTHASSATVVTVWNTNVSLPIIIVPGYAPVPTYGSLQGYAVGATAGALAGGSVTACSVSWSCVSTAIGSNGWYAIGSLPSGAYTVMVAPLSGAGYQAGYYGAGFTGNFTTSSSSASPVSVLSTASPFPRSRSRPPSRRTVAASSSRSRRHTSCGPISGRSSRPGRPRLSASRRATAPSWRR